MIMKMDLLYLINNKVKSKPNFWSEQVFNIISRSCSDPVHTSSASGLGLLIGLTGLTGCLPFI